MKQLILDRRLITDTTIGKSKNPVSYGLMMVAFKYIGPSLMRIIKVSERKTCTHFPEMEGLDYLMPEYFSDMELVKYSDLPFVYEPINYN